MFRYIMGFVLLASSTAALADDVSYSYIQASYFDVDVDFDFGGSADGDGFGIAGSVAVNDDWYVFADYATVDLGSGVDLKTTSIGGGWHRDMSQITDFFVQGGLVKGEVDISGLGSGDDTGFGVAVGLRSMIRPQLELTGSIGYVDLDDFGDGTAISVGGWYTVSGNLALGLGASFDDDVTQYGLSIRLYFDR